MTDISSLTSSATAFVSNEAAALKKAAGTAQTSFENTLSKVQSALLPKPKTGFTSGPTYEAGTLLGQTKAALGNAVSATESALHIKP